MNVVYIINQLRKSGPVNVLYNIVSNLNRVEFTPIIIKLMCDDKERSYTYKFKELGIEIIELNLSFWSLELKTESVAKLIDSLLKEKKIDILHTHGYHPLLISSYMKTHAIKIDTMHCVSVDSFKSSRGLLIGRYMHYRYIHRLKKIDHRVGISRTVTNYYKDIIGDDRCSTVYNGVNTNIYNLALLTKVESLKDKLGLREYNKIFVVVGHLTALKDPLTVIRAFIKLVDTHKDDKACLVFCGTGPLYEKCKLLALDYPMIKFVGFVDNVNEYLKIADFSICASKSEGFGLNFVEALLCRCLVISSKIDAFMEFSSIYPKLKSLHFRVSDHQTLAEIISSVLSKPVDIDDIVNDASTRFSASTMSLNYMNLYKKLLKDLKV